MSLDMITTRRLARAEVHLEEAQRHIRACAAMVQELAGEEAVDEDVADDLAQVRSRLADLLSEIRKPLNPETTRALAARLRDEVAAQNGGGR